MPSSESLRFVRVVYDDRSMFPWVVVWGEDHEWCSCRTMDCAEDKASWLRGVCGVFHEWVTKQEEEDDS